MYRLHVTLLVLLDLNAAFDTVDHSIHRLQTRFGISDAPLSWFRSYLSDRKQFVPLDGTSSRDQPVAFGVPQGSCLGPLLFTLYTSPLIDVINSHLPSMHCYANDTQLYLSFKPISLASERSALIAIESYLSDIRSWFLTNKLLTNDSKTEFQMIRTRQQLS